ncbi:MAG: tRNA (adenosine(37)-N6)-threonylcarbamoyltransferase complex ATPase subunit type 1 TsaE [bacterium]|nr:tRNA (adenosine(37)-N6)-threonylcarbamoyltransferase complex ATPase subunit type 1 TsaE [bacterium]
MPIQIHNLESFQQAASDFVSGLKPSSSQATVVGLYGDLGAGKTTFVQAAARALGISERISSPTFWIVKSYKLKVKSFQKLIHVDAYRLKNADDLRKLGFSELLTDPKNLIFIEWAERVADLLPPDHIKLQFEFVDDHTRSIEFHRSGRMLE